MAEYIEREKIWSALNGACVPYNRATAKAIESIPVADVVPRKDYESMERTVDKLNKALAERKRGKWVLYDKGFGFTHYCSLCNFTIKEQWIDFYNFCPNCGADLRGGRNEA